MSFLICYNKSDFSDFLNKSIKITSCNKYTKAYIIDLFIRYIKSHNDLSTQSITLLYKQAIESGQFDKFQIIADWLFFTKGMFPNALTGASEEYYTVIAQNAYYKCYLLLDRQWLIYEELADQFPYLTSSINESLGFIKQNDF